jgi:zinc transport system permease protein
VWEFGRDSILAVLLAGGLCAFLGVYILLRRVVFVSAAVTQASGLGIAVALYLASFAGAAGGDGQPGPGPLAHLLAYLLSPQLFSLAAGIGCALLLSRDAGRAALASETRVGLGWVLAGALLLLTLSSKRIVAEAHQVDELLYGSAILVTRDELVTTAITVAALLLVHLLLFKELVFISFDGEMARTLGYRTRLWDALLFATLGVGISVSVRCLGALPAFGFLVLPGAAAQLIARRVVSVFALAVAFALAAGLVGYYFAFSHEWPAGPALVVAAALFLIPGSLVRLLWRRT